MADNREEVGSYYGCKYRDDKECEDVEDDQAEEEAAVGLKQGWGYHFHKVSQLGLHK